MTCSEGKVFNKLKDSCICSETTFEDEEGKCQECEKRKWNEQTLRCEQCERGEVWDHEYQRCRRPVQAVPVETCDGGKKWNEEVKKCTCD